MHEFTVKILLNDDDMEDIKRLNALTKKSVPDLFGNDTLEDTIRFVANAGFEKGLQNLLKTYHGIREEGVNT